MKRKLVTILIGCMTLGLFGCGSGSLPSVCPESAAADI